MKHLLHSLTLCVVMLFAAIVAKAQGDVTAKWDFKNDLPEGIQTATNYQKTTVDIPSTVEGVSMHVDATNGKLYCVGRNNAQFNEGTKLQVPVKSTRDIVVVENYPNFQGYTIGGVAATADVNEHRATTDEVAKGYVEIVATASGYLYSVQVTFVSAISTKELYSTDFSNWGAYETTANDKEVTTATWNTKYSHEKLTFSVFNTQIGATNFNTGKFPDWTGGMLMAAKSDNPYIETSALASITKVHFRHGATGGNRGWKLLAKGDGDADWVVVSSTVANPAGGCDVDVDINKTNCQLRFENITNNQNAYLLELAIYGQVDMSKTPALGKVTVNGTDYQAADICEEDADGNMCATIEISKKKQMVDKDNNPVVFGTPDNGEIQSIEYTKVDDISTLVTVVVKAGDQTATYKLTVAFKPDYTLTYYNTDGSVLEATQQVEKDSPIATLRNSDGVIVADGKAFRGWFVEADGGRKYTAEDIVTGPTALYAVATDIEVASDVNRYTYNLTDPYFYAEDHEGFVPTAGAFHDKQHGWAFGADDKINIISGRHSLIFITGCKYSGANTVTLKNGEAEVGTITLDKTNDGVMQSIEYTGEPGTLTLSFDGGMYIHKLVVANLGDASTEKNELGYYVVEAGNAGNFLTMLDLANANAKADERTCIFLPNGTYDLGETVLTTVSGNNISIIGQSMDKTIIKNAPKVKNEGIGTTATLYVTGKNLYMQDLTLQNALDYYNSGSAGRAVCLQDKGDGTICKNVKMLSYQDTYYSNGNGKYYWEDSEIHGTVDFLCGGGDVYYNRCKIVVEKRQADGKGGCTIAAPYTDNGCQWGYVMNNCTVDNYAENFNFGRAWGGTPRLAYLNTTLLQPDKIIKDRFTVGGMNVPADKFVEYNTMDAQGNVVSPASNVLTFKKDKKENTMETILTADQAAEYALDKVFPTWTPDADCAQIGLGLLSATDGNISWTAADGAKAYAVFYDDKFVGMTSATTWAVAAGETADKFVVRPANAMGGFGGGSTTTTGINSLKVNAENVLSTSFYSLDGSRVDGSQHGVLIMVQKMTDGSIKTAKIVK